MGRPNVHAPDVRLVVCLAPGFAVDADDADELAGEGSENHVLAGIGESRMHERGIECHIILQRGRERERLGGKRLSPECAERLCILEREEADFYV